MSDDAKRELRLLRERDRRRKMLKKAGRLTPNNSESSIPAETYDVDSVEHVIDFTRNHEALYEFHYLDENKMVRNVGLFTDTQKSPHHTPSVCSPTRLLHVPEEDEEDFNTSTSCPVTFTGGDEVMESDDKDSGLSGIDTKRNVQEPSSRFVSYRSPFLINN